MMIYVIKHQRTLRHQTCRGGCEVVQKIGSKQPFDQVAENFNLKFCFGAASGSRALTPLVVTTTQKTPSLGQSLRRQAWKFKPCWS
jgi:hypothetical protein